MKNRIGMAFISLGIALIVAAASLLTYNIIENINAGRSSREVLGTISSQMSEVKRPIIGRKEMPVVEIDGYEYIGYLTIPSLDLVLPVMSEWDYTRLTIAPCRYSGTTYDRDLVIAAHNYTSHFGLLKNLMTDDEVSFTDMDGIRWNYRVAEVDVLEPDQIEEMKDSPWELTLFTCTLGGQHRVTIRCEAGEFPMAFIADKQSQ